MCATCCFLYTMALTVLSQLLTTDIIIHILGNVNGLTRYYGITDMKYKIEVSIIGKTKKQSVVAQINKQSVL